MSRNLQLIENPSILIHVLHSRLPKSASMYNMVLFHSKFQPEMKFFTVCGAGGTIDISEYSWILAVYKRKENRDEISSSAPLDPFRDITTTQLQDAILSADIINWNRSYCFTGIDSTISHVFSEMSSKMNGAKSRLSPCYTYWMDKEAIQGIENEIQTLSKQIQTNADTKIEMMSSVNSKETVQFFVQSWEYSSPGTDCHVAEVLKNNPSEGIFINGNIVCGILLNSNGQMGMLSTLPEWRRKGFGALTMKSLIVTLGKLGYVPCSTVYKSNLPSNEFHAAVGLKVSHSVDLISYDQYE